MLAIMCLLMLSLLLSSTVNGKQSRFEKYPSGSNKDYDAAIQFLWENDAKFSTMKNKEAKANFKNDADLTEENKQNLVKVNAEMSKFRKKCWKKATSFAWKDFKDKNETIYRWFKNLSVLGVDALPRKKFERLQKIISDMGDIYSKAKVCRKNYPRDKPCDLSLEPEIEEILSKSRDYNELKQIWTDWRAVTGRKMKSKFQEYVKLSNEAARLNGFRDHGEAWREDYESPTFAEDVEKLWKDVEPLYMQLHAYVRRKLIEYYSDKYILPGGPIPAHLLGNMWAQDWQNIFSIVKPFPKKKSTDVSKTMVKKKMKPLDMFKMSEEFFVSLGLKPMTQQFWKRSIMEKPKGREMVCHASAWDFSDGKDFRIKMCTQVNMKDFITVHHEMGHIQYYQQYAHLPTAFHGGANPGFHEAIGDTLALSVSTRKHLRKVGLLCCGKDDYETVINSLLEIALSKIATLPFAYLVDKWRWKVFSGEFSEDLNAKWWEQRLKYQGMCPPVRRTEADFDAASKYHVAIDDPYIDYFVASIIQFQFHKSLCEAASHVGPLHECDIYKNKKAGKILSEVLSLGESVHWTEAMKIFTRGKSNKMDAQPLLEYFEPLMKWLKKQNKNEKIGWRNPDPMVCPHKRH